MSGTVRKWGGLLIRIALLTVIIWGSNLWMVRIRDSILYYRSVLRGQPSLGRATNPLMQQVVVIVVGGLRYDASLEMPYLNTLRQDGVEARCRGYFPSNSQTAWTTLISGAGPEINDAPLLDAPYEEIDSLTVDGLFTQAKRANLTTALAGYQRWERMIPAQVLDRGFFVSATDAEADGQITDVALALIRSLRPNFLLVHFSQVDHAAQSFGTASEQYQSAVRRVDSHIQEIAQTMSLTRSVLIVTADHGYLADGGHGGGEEETVITPFVMAGARVTPGPHEEIDQADIAPTIATLLGAAVPSATQGEILFDALLLDEAESTERWVAWAQQRVELGSLYLESIGRKPLSESAMGDAEVAHSSLQVRNYGSARSLAELAVQGADEEMREAREQRIRSEQQLRLPIALLTIGVPAYLLWRRWSRTTALLIISALATVLIYNVLFIREENVYSFSGIGQWDTSLAEAAMRMTTALIPAILIMVGLTWRGKKRRPVEIAATNYSFALILACFLALPLVMSYVLIGTEINWYLPDHFIAFTQVSGLVQLAVAAFLGLFVPLVTVPLDRILRWIGARVRSFRWSRARA
jgi:hypothetical protein